jgi:acyl carrier protein
VSTDEFLNEFAEVLAVDRAAIALDTPLSSLEAWDSVAYLGMMVMLEEKMGVTIPPDTLVEAKTPGDLLNTVKSLQ